MNPTGVISWALYSDTPERLQIGYFAAWGEAFGGFKSKNRPWLGALISGSPATCRSCPEKEKRKSPLEKNREKKEESESEDYAAPYLELDVGPGGSCPLGVLHVPRDVGYMSQKRDKVQGCKERRMSRRT